MLFFLLQNQNTFLLPGRILESGVITEKAEKNYIKSIARDSEKLGFFIYTISAEDTQV